MKNFIVPAAISMLLLVGCKGESSQSGTVDLKSSEPIVETELSNSSLGDASCLASIEIALKSMDFQVLSTTPSKDRIQYLIQSADQSDPVSITCKLAEGVVTEIVNQGSRMPRSILQQKNVMPGVFHAISNLPHRAMTTSDANGGIVKHYSRFNFQAPSAGNYCLSVQHLSASEKQNSLFVSSDNATWTSVSLPVDADNRVTTEIENPQIEASKPGVYPVRVRHRENTVSYGFSVDRCTTN